MLAKTSCIIIKKKYTQYNLNVLTHLTIPFEMQNQVAVKAHNNNTRNSNAPLLLWHASLCVCVCVCELDVHSLSLRMHLVMAASVCRYLCMCLCLPMLPVLLFISKLCVQQLHAK